MCQWVDDSEGDIFFLADMVIYKTSFLLTYLHNYVKVSTVLIVDINRIHQKYQFCTCAYVCIWSCLTFNFHYILFDLLFTLSSYKLCMIALRTVNQRTPSRIVATPDIHTALGKILFFEARDHNPSTTSWTVRLFMRPNKLFFGYSVIVDTKL